MLKKESYFKRFDTSLIHAEASDNDLINFIDKCIEIEDFLAGIAFNVHHIPLAAKLLKGTNLKICAPIAYPLGGLPTEIKIKQAQSAVDNGATQLDIVMAIEALLDNDFDKAQRDANDIVEKLSNKVESLSLIANISYLSKEQKTKAFEIVMKSGADVFKTNTGFGLITDSKDIAMIREKFGPAMKIMVSGGVRNSVQATQMFEAGANIIATGSIFEIVKELDALYT